MRVSILDDYQGAALRLADWSGLAGRIDIAVERAPFADEDAAQRALAQSEIVVAMRERTPFPRSLFARLPKLRLLITTGMRNAAIDMAAARDHNVTVCGTEGSGTDTAELAWALILGCARRVADEHRSMRDGEWQTRLGLRLQKKTLGLVGLGKLGTVVARVGLAFDMKVIAWSQNLTSERATAVGVERVDKEDLFRQADVVSVHVVLSDRSRGLIGQDELALMKPDAILVNTSRGPIVDTDAVIAALSAGRLGYAGFDVFDHEPLARDHQLRQAPNVLLTPHVGYVTEENYRQWYPQIVEDISGFLDGKPVRVLSPA